MFNFSDAADTSERMDELERFLEFWYGPRKPEYGEPEERLRRLPLPYPLSRFYSFAGRRPYPGGNNPEGFFYEGMGVHHLFPFDHLTILPDGLLKFFSEYQGDWVGLTLLDEDDPPVWIDGRWIEGNDEVGPRRKQLSGSLSRLLITHCLMTTVLDWDNCQDCSSDVGLKEWFLDSSSDIVRIWSADGLDCPLYRGEFFLFYEYVLAYRYGAFLQFASNHPIGVARMKAHLRGRA